MGSFRYSGGIHIILGHWTVFIVKFYIDLVYLEYNTLIKCHIQSKLKVYYITIKTISKTWWMIVDSIHLTLNLLYKT